MGDHRLDLLPVRQDLSAVHTADFGIDHRHIHPAVDGGKIGPEPKFLIPQDEQLIKGGLQYNGIRSRHLTIAIYPVLIQHTGQLVFRA